MSSWAPALLDSWRAAAEAACDAEDAENKALYPFEAYESLAQCVLDLPLIREAKKLSEAVQRLRDAPQDMRSLEELERSGDTEAMQRVVDRMHLFLHGGEVYEHVLAIYRGLLREAGETASPIARRVEGALWNRERRKQRARDMRAEVRAELEAKRNAERSKRNPGG